MDPVAPHGGDAAAVAGVGAVPTPRPIPVLTQRLTPALSLAMIQLMSPRCRGMIPATDQILMGKR